MIEICEKAVEVTAVVDATPNCPERIKKHSNELKKLIRKYSRVKKRKVIRKKLEPKVPRVTGTAIDFPADEEEFYYAERDENGKYDRVSAFGRKRLKSLRFRTKTIEFCTKKRL